MPMPADTHVARQRPAVVIATVALVLVLTGGVGVPPAAAAGDGVTPDHAVVHVGQKIGFTLTVANAGPGDDNAVTIDDALPPGVVWGIDSQSNGTTSLSPASPKPLCSISGAAGSQRLNCGGPTTQLAATKSFSVHISALTSPTACGTYVYHAVVNTVEHGATVSTKATIQCIQLSVSITPKKQSVVAGQTARFAVTVTNNGGDTLTAVRVVDPVAASCSRAIGALAASQSKSYVCAAKVTTELRNFATASGVSQTDGTIRASAVTRAPAAVTMTAATHVTHRSGITIVRTPKTQSIPSGSSPKFTLAVHNTGDLALTAVSVSDARSPGCNRNLGTLAAGTSSAYSCPGATVSASYTDVAVASGRTAGGARVAGEAESTVDVVKPTPPAVAAIAIGASPSIQTVKAGGTATFTFTVANTGTAALLGVTVSDPLSPGCNRYLGAVAAGVRTSYTCIRAGVTSAYLDSATVTGTSASGSVHAASTSAVRVRSPGPIPPIPVLPHRNTADLKIAIQQIGASETFEITVRNLDPRFAATNVDVAANGLPASCAHHFASIAPDPGYRQYTCAPSQFRLLH
jgi:uncharacterized repeat protein (TIGR01451 family)